MKKSRWWFSFLLVLAVACSRNEELADTPDAGGPTPYNLVIPQGLPPMNIPENNPMTVEGVALGKKLFYDPILSGNNTQSCSSCHQAHSGFSQLIPFSTGIQGLQGRRNSMPIINLGWQPSFFWDGGASDLETQVLGPIENPLELHEDLSNVIEELNNHSTYPALFKAAFGQDQITTVQLMKAIAQFERTMISGNSRYDQYMRGETNLTPLELEGMEVFSDMSKGDCNHCHVLGSTFTDFEFRNTGLDSLPEDLGRYYITLLNSDMGKFKTPTLRNIASSPPYMHDGRFWTLMECVEHYNTGFHYTANLDGNLLMSQKGRMTPYEMEAIVAFLHTLTDEEFINNPAFRP